MIVWCYTAPRQPADRLDQQRVARVLVEDGDAETLIVVTLVVFRFHPGGIGGQFFQKRCGTRNRGGGVVDVGGHGSETGDEVGNEFGAHDAGSVLFRSGR